MRRTEQSSRCYRLSDMPSAVSSLPQLPELDRDTDR